MELVDHMQAYFKGERDLAFILVPFGLAMLSLAYYLFKHYKGTFPNSLMITAIVIGLGLVGAGSFMAVKATKDVAAKTVLLEQDRESFVAAEVKRIKNINQDMWPILIMVWSTLILAGTTIIFFVDNPTARGVGLGLMLGGAVFMVVDLLAEHRAIIYQKHLQAELDT